MRGASTLNSASRSRSGVGRVSIPSTDFSLRLRNSPPITRMSPDLHQTVAALPMIANKRHRVLQLPGRRRICNERLRLAARHFEHIVIANDVPDPERRKTALLGAEELPGSAQLQVHLGDVESIGRVHNGSNPLTRRVAHLSCHQDAIALLAAPPHTPTQLMKLRQAETLSLLDYHQCGVRHVHSYLDHRGRNQNLHLTAPEFFHHPLALIRFQTPV